MYVRSHDLVYCQVTHQCWSWLLMRVSYRLTSVLATHATLTEMGLTTLEVCDMREDRDGGDDGGVEEEEKAVVEDE